MVFNSILLFHTYKHANLVTAGGRLHEGNSKQITRTDQSNNAQENFYSNNCKQKDLLEILIFF